jgi:single-stranded-DNA-specific exonuclease
MPKDLQSEEIGPLSFRGRRWTLPAPDGHLVRDLTSSGMARPLAEILAVRGVKSRDLATFLDPKIRDAMPDPHVLKDMENAARRLATAIRARQRIGIWSDYDVDGATSAGVLGRFLRMCGHDDFQVRIPDRISEGYGPNTPGLLAMGGEGGCGLICILDAGTVAFEPLEAAHAAGIDVIVMDHHAAEPTLPPAVAVVNPNRKDETSGLGHLCAAGVTFMFAVAVTRILRDKGHFDGRDGRPDEVPPVMELLDLVALGTVCDVVPLIGLNRAFVARGLEILSRRLTPGIAALAEVAGVKPEAAITETDCGWVLGPRINAGGRIGDSASGALLLLETDPAMARERALALEDMNVQRKEIGDAATQSAIESLAGRVPGAERTLALAVVDAHEGVVGISAGRLKEAFDAPAIVLTHAHDGALKGSARSVPGFDIGHAIIAARHAGLIVKGGGHGMAGGLTLTRDQMPGFIAFMNAEIEKSDYFTTGVRTAVDAAIPLGEVGVPFIQGMDKLRPFGTANVEPLVMLPGVELAEIRVLKEKHFKLVFRDGAASIDGLIWNAVGTPLGARIEAARGTRLDVIGRLQINEYLGRKSAQMMIEDLRPAEGALL